MEDWELRDLKAHAASVEGKLDGWRQTVHSFLDNCKANGLNYTPVFHIVNALISWSRFARTRANVESSVSKLAGRLSADTFFQGYAELENGVSCISAARSDVLLNAVKDRDYDLNFHGKVQIGPVSEAEALYYGNDNKVHLEEVKNTLNAFCEKAQGTPQQFANLLEWKRGGLNRVVTVKVRTATTLNPAARKRFREANVAQAIKDWIRDGLEIVIAGTVLRIDAVDDLFRE